MSLASRVSELATRIAAEFKTLRTPTAGGIGYNPGWADLNASFVSFARRSPDGTVTVGIRAKRSSPVAVGSTPFTLAAGFRPVRTEPDIVAMYNSIDDTWSGYAHVSIGPSGAVVVTYVSRSADTVFGTITFPTT